MLIDRFLPAAEVSSRHEVTVDAPAERVWAAVRALELGESPVVRGLMALRSLPGLFARGTPERRRLGMDMEGLLETAS